MLTEIVLSDMLRNVTNVCSCTREKTAERFSWHMKLGHVKEIRRYGSGMEKSGVPGNHMEKGMERGPQNPFVTNQSLRKDKIVIAS